jgi:hypothetical protein
MSKTEEALERAEGKLERIKRASLKVAGTVMQTAETSAAGFGSGYARGRWGDTNGDLKVAGIDVDLGGAFLLHGLGYLGALGPYAEHAHNFADGLLTAWSHAQGMRMGAESRVAVGTTTSGARSAADRLREQLRRG